MMMCAIMNPHAFLGIVVLTILRQDFDGTLIQRSTRNWISYIGQPICKSL